MSLNHQHKKRHSSDHSDFSGSDARSEHCSRGQCYDQCRPCIVCPPCDCREKYESSSCSESSCPDFSELCEDRPKICCEKKDLCKKRPRKDHSDKDRSESSDSEHSEKQKKHGKKYRDCRGCDKQCNKCSKCKACGCKECSDYSRSSVVSSLGGSDSS